MISIKVRQNGSTVFYYCEHCKKNHVHGIDRVPGHRLSHCTNPDSPYYGVQIYLEGPVA